MLPLTEHLPKPLLEVNGTPLIEYHIRSLANAGFRELVINVSYLADKITSYCGTGKRWGVDIRYSLEATPLETAGGLLHALPLLGSDPFLVVNADIWTDYPFAQLASYTLRTNEQAHLVLVDNPPQHPLGDFALTHTGWCAIKTVQQAGLTYAGIGIYTSTFISEHSASALEGIEVPDVVNAAAPKLALRPLLESAIAQRRVGGEYYSGCWEDVGTPERLRALHV